MSMNRWVIPTIMIVFMLSFVLSQSGETSDLLAEPHSAPFFLPYEENTQVSDLAVDASGGVHVTYKSPFQVGDIVPIYYAYCAADCTEPSNWTAVTVGDARLGVAGVIALTADGRPRLLWYYQQTTLGDGTYIYAACEANCLDGANWSQTAVTTTKSQAHRNFTLSPEGQPRFVYTDIATLHKGLFYAYCDSDCTTETNWAELSLSEETQFDEIDLLAGSDGTLHLLYHFNNAQVEYVHCSENCSALSSWQGLALYTIGVEAELALALTDNNQPRFALYTGAADRQTYYVWCQADCTSSQNNWQNWSVGLGEFEGEHLDLALDSSNRPYIAYHTQNLSLGYAACEANCESDQPMWMYASLETAADLNAAEPAPPGCALTSWDVGEFPAIVLDGNDHPLISYDATQILSGCADVQKVRFIGAEDANMSVVYLPFLMR